MAAVSNVCEISKSLFIITLCSSTVWWMSVVSPRRGTSTKCLLHFCSKHLKFVCAWRGRGTHLNRPIYSQCEYLYWRQFQQSVSPSCSLTSTAKVSPSPPCVPSPTRLKVLNWHCGSAPQWKVPSFISSCRYPSLCSRGRLRAAAFAPLRAQIKFPPWNVS